MNGFKSSSSSLGFLGFGGKGSGSGGPLGCFLTGSLPNFLFWPAFAFVSFSALACVCMPPEEPGRVLLIHGLSDGGGGGGGSFISGKGFLTGSSFSQSRPLFSILSSALFPIPPPIPPLSPLLNPPRPPRPPNPPRSPEFL